MQTQLILDSVSLWFYLFRIVFALKLCMSSIIVSSFVTSNFQPTVFPNLLDESIFLNIFSLKLLPCPLMLMWSCQVILSFCRNMGVLRYHQTIYSNVIRWLLYFKKAKGCDPKYKKLRFYSLTVNVFGILY